MLLTSAKLAKTTRQALPYRSFPWALYQVDMWEQKKNKCWQDSIFKIKWMIVVLLERGLALKPARRLPAYSWSLPEACGSSLEQQHSLVAAVGVGCRFVDKKKRRKMHKLGQKKINLQFSYISFKPFFFWNLLQMRTHKSVKDCFAWLMHSTFCSATNLLRSTQDKWAIGQLIKMASLVWNSPRGQWKSKN